MAKKNRVHANFRLHPDTYKVIKKYAKKDGVSEGVAVDCLIGSLRIKESQLLDMEEELKKLTNNSPAF